MTPTTLATATLEGVDDVRALGRATPTTTTTTTTTTLGRATTTATPTKPTTTTKPSRRRSLGVVGGQPPSHSAHLPEPETAECAPVRRSAIVDARVTSGRDDVTSTSSTSSTSSTHRRRARQIDLTPRRRPPLWSRDVASGTRASARRDVDTSGRTNARQRASSRDAAHSTSCGTSDRSDAVGAADTRLVHRSSPRAWFRALAASGRLNVSELPAEPATSRPERAPALDAPEGAPDDENASSAILARLGTGHDDHDDHDDHGRDERQRGTDHHGDR